MVSMMLHPDENVIELRVEGTITREDYDNLMPELDPLLVSGNGAMGFLVRLEDFDGWTPGALVREAAFDLKNRSRIGPVAVVGEGRFTQWGTQLSNAFFPAEVKFYLAHEITEARRWLGLPTEGVTSGGRDENDRG